MTDPDAPAATEDAPPAPEAVKPRPARIALSAAEYERRARERVDAWENAQPSALQRAGTAAGRAVGRALGPLGRAVPPGVQDGVTRAVEAALDGLGHAAALTSDAARIAAAVERARPESSGELEARDRVADRVAKLHIVAAGAEGGALGAAGAPGIAADVAAFMVIALRCLHETAVAYGYGEDTEQERQFTRGILMAVSAEGAEGRRKALYTLGALGGRAGTWRGADALLASALAAPLVERFGVREVARRLGMQLAGRKAFQLLPVAGAAVGGGVNAVMLGNVAEAAQMVYRRRWLDDRLPVVEAG